MNVPKKPRPRIPSMEERKAAAVELGLIEPGEELSPRLQRQMAQVITLAQQNEQAEQAATPVPDPVPKIITTYRRLRNAGMSDESAARILAAMFQGAAQ